MSQATITTPLYVNDLFSAPSLIQCCQRLDSQVVIVTDDVVAALYGDALTQHLVAHKLPNQTIVIPAGEQSKSRAMKSHIEDQLLAWGCDQQTCILALGGGVITDLAGFVAATYYRGIPAVYLPTTLLAMVDAALGGKTAINTPHGKNLIGIIQQPHAIFVDPQLLRSLPDQEYRTAFAEIIKHALICDPGYMDELTQQADALLNKEIKALTAVITRSAIIKSHIVATATPQDPVRDGLNLGHTIAHALEQLSDYTLNHGQAVAIGIIVESYLATQLGLLDDAAFIQIKNLIARYEIPLRVNTTLSKDALHQALLRDKKSRQCQPHFVLLKAIGTIHRTNTGYTTAVPERALDQALDYLLQLCVA